MKIIYSLIIIITILSCNEKKSSNLKEHNTYNETDTLNSIIDNSSFKNEDEIYLKFQTEKEKIIEKLKSSSKNEANKLFIQYSKTNEEIISKINEKEGILLSKFYDEDTKSKVIIKELDNKLSNNQLRLEEIGEGYVDIVPIASFYYDIFKNYVTEDYKDYIFLVSEENKNLYSADAGLVITFKQLGERIISWESFLSKYPKFELLDEVKSSLMQYRFDYIFGLDNTPTFERDFESQTEENKKISYIYDENEKEFNSFLKKYPNSPTSKLITLFIENHKEMQEEALFELIRNEINKK